MRSLMFDFFHIVASRGVQRADHQALGSENLALTRLDCVAVSSIALAEPEPLPPTPDRPGIEVRDAFESVIAAAARIESWQGPVDF